MRSLATLFLVLLSLVSTVSSVSAEKIITGTDFSLDLSFRGEYLFGHSEYKISGSDYYWGSWESRLKWPLDCFLLGGSAVLGFSQNDFALNISFLTNLTENPGDLKDYDWVSAELVSKGVLDTNLEAHIFDIGFDWNLVKKPQFFLGLGLGYTWQHFYWEGDSELAQTEYDSAYNRYFDITPGTYYYPKELWITYRMDYHLPYLAVKANYEFSPWFQINGTGKAMIIVARDKDDHVQRQKMSKTTYYGAGLEGGIEGIISPTPWIYLALAARGTYLTAVGDQDQTFYDGSGLKYTGIDAEAESLQGYLGARIGLSF